MIEKCTLIEPFACNKTDKIKDVAKKLKEYGQRHIYVLDKGKPVGIISVTDIIDRVVIAGKNAADVTAAQVMNPQIYTFEDKDKVKNAYKLMSEKGIISVPITEKGKYIGILSLKEAVRYVTDPKNIE